MAPGESSSAEGATFTSGDPDAVYPSTSVRNEGVVPPFLEEPWRKLRAKLNEVGAAAYVAASGSTTEDIRRNLGAASAALMDADFLLRQIEKGRVPHQHEKWQLQESAKGGMYCAACGEEVPDGGDQE